MTLPSSEGLIMYADILCMCVSTFSRMSTHSLYTYSCLEIAVGSFRHLVLKYTYNCLKIAP